jgi:hypothetical protein
LKWSRQQAQYPLTEEPTTHEARTIDSSSIDTAPK